MGRLDFSTILRGDHLASLGSSVLTMLELTALTWLLAMVVGIVLALVRMSPSTLMQRAVAVYVEYHQNVPMLVQIFLWYFGISTFLPQEWQQWLNHHGSEFFFAFISVGLAMGAYVSEALRSGIRSIPSSQHEAARALGLTFLQSYRLVVLPQALRIALPALISHTVLLFKNTSLAMTIGVAELTYITREIENESFRTVEIYMVATVIYLAISLTIMALGSRIERRTSLAGR